MSTPTGQGRPEPGPDATPGGTGSPRRSRPEKLRDERSGRTQDALAHSAATDVTAYLLAGPATFGLIGHGLDRWWGTGFCLPTGLVLGFLLSLYVVWVRYGRA
ncbi:hypothetical protein [Arsenicicoccus dermatophilus]|uniref:AtpZ/AtpI family protein n=1 Tax=Arsenicicoccus dermatophilus TaxID=1076331 RepID=UPI003916F8CB